MFAKTIIDSDAFLDMPLSTQSLYFHLSMRADDDGFINNPKKIQRMVGCGDDDLKLLMAKRFILVFDSGVIVIKHWKIHNYIRNDRYKPTLYQEEKAELAEKNSKAYTFKTEVIESENHLGIPDDNRMGYQMDTQVRLGKDRLVKDKKKNSVEPSSTMHELFEKVWKTYPKKTNKKK
ncbi:DNA replication protein, partial [Enterococcus faecalis]